tara:strand:- start:333 stop:1148 length:816 start_codon:yes stop_codon:yes gene_type:complete
MTSRKQLVACPKNYLAANNEAEEDFNKNVACAVQTIATQEDGFLSQDQCYMLVLRRPSNAMLIGAPVDHGHQPILVSLSTLYVDAKQIKNGMDNNDKASTTEESQAIDLRLDSNIAESCLSEVYEGLQNTEMNKGIQNMKQLKNKMNNNNQASTTEESQATGLRLDLKIAESSLSEAYEGIQNTKQLKNGIDNNNQAAAIEESQATGLRLDSKIAESCFSEVNKGIQNAAAQQAFSPVVPVVSRSVYLRCVRKGFFKYIKTIHLLMLAVIF